MAKQPRRATAHMQMTLFPVPNEEDLCKQPFTITLLNGRKLTISLKAIRRLPPSKSEALAADAQSKPDAS
jgi:hypothetical protein